VSAIATRPARFHKTRLTQAQIAALVAQAGDDGPGLQTALVDAIQPFAEAGLAWSCGRERIAFQMARVVAKLPLNMSGVAANALERTGFRRTLAGKTDCPVAACRVLHNADGVPILLMRTVDPVVSTQDLPAWTLWIDCGQVGLDRRGRLVAYDL
jgi:hypothetical protein